MSLPTIPEQYRPERKIVAAAVATLAVWLLQSAGVDVPIGVEGAIVTVAGYLMPATSRGTWDGPLTADD